jgi:hypothetical protein
MRSVTLTVLLTLAASTARAQSITEYTTGFEKLDGFVPMYWDADGGRLLLEVQRLDQDFLYLTAHATGFGYTSLPDRGEIFNEWIARFERAGPKVLLILRNTRFRALNTDNAALVRSVDESFPTSTVAAFDIVAREDDRLLIDATSHFVRDHLNVVQELKQANQGTFTVNRDRSRIHLPRTKAFPTNSEIEVALTFTADAPGSIVRRHAPDARAITVRQHHSLVQLPDDSYTPRTGDPRVGSFGVSFYDFARGLDDRYEVRYVGRHRLQKRDPDAPMSEPVEQIVYYMDAAIPEPYRTAFKEGAMWWNEVFEAAGFIDAFRVEDMPHDMDPMDARYNVIQWVHRTNPGSSIGPSLYDPRTGEIIKVAVRMDAWRSLTDYNLYAGTIPSTGDPAAFGLTDWLATLDQDVSGEEFTMARRRQHAAHEVGHTLGLSHNFVAASYGRASVMDYPAPFIQLRDGQIDLSDAYRAGPGAYDSIAIRYAYTEYRSPEEERAGLESILEEALQNGIRFNADGDNASWSSDPDVTQWINGGNTIDELTRMMEVRRALIERFNETAIDDGDPMVWLNYRFAPIYLHHRFQLQAAIKNIGGMSFRYAVRGEEVPPTQIVTGDEQRRALETVLDALEPAELAIPERVLRLMTPRGYGVPTDRWYLQSDASPAFDQIGAARTLAAMVIGDLFARQRTARLVAFHARDPDLPTLEEVIARVIDRTWSEQTSAGELPLRRVVQRVVVDELIDLAANRSASVETRAGAEWGLRQISELIQTTDAGTPSDQAHRLLAWSDIDRFLNRRAATTERSGALAAPPGTPIGN